MKKLLVLLAAVLLVLTSLTGCSSSKPQEDGEVTTLTFDLSTLYTVPALEVTQGTEDALNDYLLNTLHENFKIKLIITSIGDYFTKIPMELASGGEDCPDIIQVFTLSSDVGNGYLLPLDQYLDNELKPTVDLMGNIFECGKVNKQVFMVPRYFGTVLDWKWVYNKGMVEEAGVDVSGVKDIETLGAALAELKTAYPDDHFLAYLNELPRIYRGFNKTSLFASYAATVGEDTTIYDWYETDAFVNAINKAFEWKQAGYADPEGSQNSTGHDVLAYTGSCKGLIIGHSAQADPIAQSFTRQNTYGATFGANTIHIDDKETETLGVGITYTCKDPSAAARFINLLYNDEYVWDTIIYGVEGRDWVWNADHTLYAFPEGLDFATVPYQVSWSCGMIGNGFYTRVFDSGMDSNSDPEYGMKLLNNAWVPPLYGFNPSNDNVFNEAAAVSNVVTQYNDVLVYGDVDPAVEYPKFIAALKEAGIDKVIADYQAQADEWLKTK